MGSDAATGLREDCTLAQGEHGYDLSVITVQHARTESCQLQASFSPYEKLPALGQAGCYSFHSTWTPESA